MNSDGQAAVRGEFPVTPADPFDWYIEPGIYEVCRMIVDSGLGDTHFSCEGHIYRERGPHPEGVDPYVSLGVLDWSKVADLIQAVQTVKDKHYSTEVYFRNYPSRTMAIYLNVNRQAPYEAKTRQGFRQRVLEQARAHLAEVVRSTLYPDAQHYLCRGKPCRWFQMGNLAQPGKDPLPAPACLCESLTEETVLSFGHGAKDVGIKRCPFFEGGKSGG